MDITKKDIAEFQALYKEKFNIELDNQTAYEKLNLLVRQLEIVYQPIMKHQYNDFMSK